MGMRSDGTGADRAKGGRPLKDASKGKRAKYAFRMSDFTRDQLEGKASESGRSLSEEVEYRIEQSLQKDGRLNTVLTMLGGAEMIMFATLMNGDLRIAIGEADAKAPSKLQWFESPEKVEIVRAHMAEVVGRTVDTFARMAQTGVAARTGQNISKLAE
jgi:hypothetical protein